MFLLPVLMEHDYRIAVVELGVDWRALSSTYLLFSNISAWPQYGMDEFGLGASTTIAALTGAALYRAASVDCDE